MAEIPIILLAAGSSARMGQPKQLLRWGEQTLIEYKIQLLLKTGQPLVVVLGANSGLIIPVIKKYEASIILNNNWEKGMGTSVSCGIRKVELDFPNANAVLIALPDQPLIPLSHYLALFNTFQKEKRQIIASKSESGWQGVPALFDRFYFEELQKLNGETGAKTIIRQYPANVISLLCNEITEDVDTPENYRAALHRFSGENKDF